MSGILRARLNRTSGRLVLGLALVLALVAATVVVDLPAPPPAGAATNAVVGEAYRGYPGYCQGTQGWPGLPVAMTVKVSNTDYAQGEIVRVTFTVGSAFPKITHEPPADPPDLLARFSGVIKIQGGWSGQEIVGWSKPDGVGSYQDGSSVVFIPGSLPQGEWYNNLFGAGQEFWIDYRAPSPVGRAGLDYWGGVITGIERADWFDVFPTQERIGSCPVDGANEAPSAGFTWVQSTTNPLEVAFTNTSSDPNGDALSYAWDFGDGTISSEVSPTHTFDQNKAYTVKLTAKDPAGATATASQVVDLRGLVVNSTGDEGAADATEGCDTGGTIGDQPECTLRAAIEVLNQKQEGTISFDIDSGTVPTIATASALPDITAPDAVIDGTTQPAGAVRITAGDRSGPALKVSGAGVKVTGLVIDRSTVGLALAAANVVVEGNAIGTAADGATAGSVTFGLELSDTATGAVIRDNVIVASTGLEVPASDVTIENNSIGVSRGGAVVGDTLIGVMVYGRNAQVTGNTIRARTLGVGVVSSDPVSGDGSTVSGNHIGVNASGSALSGQGEGVRVSGASNVTVSGNHIAPHLGAGAGVSVSGKLEMFVTATSTEGQYKYTFLYPTSPVSFDGEVTGRNVTVSDNVIGDEALGLAAGGTRPANGVVVWAEADAVTVSGNTVSGSTNPTIELHGGSGHVVVSNTVGSGAAAVATGILANASTGVTIGRVGEGNTVSATGHGIQAIDGATGSITGNTVVASGTGADTDGVSAVASSGAFSFVSNTVTGFTRGIAVASPSASVTTNVVSQSGSGIVVTTDAATVERNVVTETTTAGIAVSGADTTVEGNLVGRTTTSGPNVGNTGVGIVVAGGPATLTRNVVAGSGGNGIDVDPTAKATLRGNEVEATTGTPIVSSNAPAPALLGAVMKTTYDGADRKALLLTGLPDGAGDLEVFANASCADPEAEKVLGVTKHKDAGQTSKVILLKARPLDDNFTVTFTDTEGRTSELSTCASGEVYPDSDGDGSPDPLDELVGGAGDPTTGGYLTDNEQLIRLKVLPEVTDADGQTYGGGRLTGAGPVDVPPGRPANVDLPYGVFGFTIEGFEPGGTTGVGITVVDGEQVKSDDTYWKYGPLATGEDPVWYDFAVDEETGSGALVGDPVLVPGFGYRRNLALLFTDGQRGDDDGAMNGSIHDPGGIARELAGGPTDPVDPTPTIEQPTVSPETLVDGGAAEPTSPEGSLPYTGSDDGRLFALGTVLLAAGAVVVAGTRLTTRRRRHRWAHRA